MSKSNAYVNIAQIRYLCPVNKWISTFSHLLLHANKPFFIFFKKIFHYYILYTFSFKLLYLVFVNKKSIPTFDFTLLVGTPCFCKNITGIYCEFSCYMVLFTCPYGQIQYKGSVICDYLFELSFLSWFCLYYLQLHVVRAEKPRKKETPPGLLFFVHNCDNLLNYYSYYTFILQQF